jgi:tetratricopeptide (TPR) repeat protein
MPRFAMKFACCFLCALTMADMLAQTSGNSYAVVVGISQYEDVRGVEWLKYAGRDANLFETNLKSPRAGGFTLLYPLLDDRATQARITEVIKTVLTVKAGPQDQVFLFFSSRGFAPPDSRHGFLLAADSRRERPLTTALKVEDLKQFILQSRARRVYVFADVCREPSDSAGNNLINLRLRELGRIGQSVETLLASQPKQLSREDDKLGGGHGVFTYYLVEGMQNPAADTDGDGKISLQELFAYVTRRVRESTGARQEPFHAGGLDGTALSDLKRPAMPRTAAGRRRPPLLFASRLWLPGSLALLAAAQEQQGGASRGSFEDALEQVNLMGPGGALDLYRREEASLSWEEKLEKGGLLAAALEERGQRVLIRYGEGDQFPNDPERLQKPDFDRAGDFFEAAESVRTGNTEADRRIRSSLDARRLFARGRAMIFDRRFTEAAKLLRASIATDPDLAESQNALGIAALEQSDPGAAAGAFTEAVRIAPDWAYARHNLALAHIESGNYLAAERDYREAIRRTPYQPYLYYNLGFLLERQNRKSEAVRQFERSLDVFDELIAKYAARGESWRKAGNVEQSRRAAERVRILKLNQAEVHNMLGVLRQAQGKWTRAEREYRAAIDGNAASNAARYNLASLEMERAKANPARREFAEAVKLWREVIERDAAHVPSRLRLAEARVAEKSYSAAAEQYRLALRDRAGNPAIEAALAEVLGDAAQQQGNLHEASEQYRSALERVRNTPAAKRIEEKLRHATPAHAAGH